MGDWGGEIGTAVPASVPEPSAAETLHWNAVPDRPVASTVSVCPFNDVPGEEVNPEIATLVPGMKLLLAVNVATPEEIEYEVIVATVLQLAPEQVPRGAGRSVISVSGALLPPAEIVLVVVRTSAMVPASQMLTYTWLLSAAAAANIRNRVVPGV